MSLVHAHKAAEALASLGLGVAAEQLDSVAQRAVSVRPEAPCAL